MVRRLRFCRALELAPFPDSAISFEIHGLDPAGDSMLAVLPDTDPLLVDEWCEPSASFERRSPDVCCVLDESRAPERQMCENFAAAGLVVAVELPAANQTAVLTEPAWMWPGTTLFAGPSGATVAQAPQIASLIDMIVAATWTRPVVGTDFCDIRTVLTAGTRCRHTSLCSSQKWASEPRNISGMIKSLLSASPQRTVKGVFALLRMSRDQASVSHPAFPVMMETIDDEPAFLDADWLVAFVKPPDLAFGQAQLDICITTDD